MMDEVLRDLGLGLQASEDELISAAGELASRYEDAADSSGQAYRGAVVPRFDATFAFVFRLHELGHVAEARRLESAVAAWIRARRHEAPSGVQALAWERARDLGALPDELSPEVRRALAYASRIGNLASATRPLRMFARVDRRLLADADLLRGLGGAFAAFADVLEPSDALGDASRALGAGRNAVVAGGALVTFLVALAFTDRHAGPATRPLMPSHGGLGPHDAALDAVARLRGSLGEGLEDQQARAIAHALSEHDCSEALERLNALTAGGPHGKAQPLVDAVVTTVRRACPVVQAK